MLDFRIQRNETSYAGLYSKPPFSLWGQGGTILAGLYDAFQSFGITTGDVRAESGTGNPAEEAVVVHFGTQAVFRFRFDRLEATISNFLDPQLDDFAAMVDSGAEWLRRSVPDLAFRSHLASYAAHGVVENGSVSDYLRSLGGPAISALGDNRGTGLIFHADNMENDWRVQFTMDHSLIVPDGLFIQLILISSEDRISYRDVVRRGKALLEGAMNEIGLAPGSEES